MLPGRAEPGGPTAVTLVYVRTSDIFLYRCNIVWVLLATMIKVYRMIIGYGSPPFFLLQGVAIQVWSVDEHRQAAAAWPARLQG